MIGKAGRLQLGRIGGRRRGIGGSAARSRAAPLLGGLGVLLALAFGTSGTFGVGTVGRCIPGCRRQGARGQANAHGQHQRRQKGSQGSQAGTRRRHTRPVVIQIERHRANRHLSSKGTVSLSAHVESTDR